MVEEGSLNVATQVLTPSAVLAGLRQAATTTALRSGVVSAAALAAPLRSAAFDIGGTTYTDQLVAKQQLAKAALEQYTTLGGYDPAAVEMALANVAAWKEAHTGVWSRIEQKVLGLLDSVSADEALTMPPDLVRSYVEAMYANATYGLNMYTNGVFARQVDAGQISASVVQSDAEARLNLYDAILTLEATGTLAQVYQASSQRAMAGLGLSEVAIVIAIVAGLAVLVGGIMYFRQTTANAALKERACAQFLATSDPVLQGSCDPVESDAVTIAKYAIGAFALGGFLYLLLPEVPGLVKRFKEI